MQVKYIRTYLASLKTYRRNKELLKKIKKTETILTQDHNDKRLYLKHIDCHTDKNRYSIRVLNTQYRILMSIENDVAELRCVCDHDEYDRKNKNC